MSGGIKVGFTSVANPFESVPHKISTTIKRKWMVRILLGTKTAELKKNTQHWKDRLKPLVGDYGTGECEIVFLCGRKVYRYWVLEVDFHFHGIDIDGELCGPHWKISLHGRACTQPAAGYCDFRNVKLNKSLQEVPFCRSNCECDFETMDHRHGDYILRKSTQSTEPFLKETWMIKHKDHVVWTGLFSSSEAALKHFGLKKEELQ